MARLLFVSDSLDVGGAERALVAAAVGLRRRGHIVDIACSRGGMLTAAAAEGDVGVLPAGDRLVKRRVDARFVSHVRAVLASGRYDVVNTHMYASTAAAVLAEPGIPVIATEHSEASWRSQRARRTARRVLYPRCAAFVAVSEGIRDRLVTVDEVAPERVQVIPNSLPPMLDFAPGAPLRAGPGPLVGVVARLVPEKGVEVLLRAVAVMRGAVPGLRVAVVGDGPERPALERLTRALGLAGVVTFTGLRADAPALIGDLDVLVVPSRSEGTPLVVLEAMSAQVPLLASAVGGIPEMVEHEKEALLVPPGDVVALARGVARVLTEPAMGAALAAAAQRRLRRDADPESQLAALERLYAEALSQPEILTP
jgi:glycosyltransferase involved in cell wall biosynthesis